MIWGARCPVIRYTSPSQAVVISDVIVLYVLKKRAFYKENKYQQVVDTDREQEYEVINYPPNDDAQPLPITVSLKPLQVNYI